MTIDWFIGGYILFVLFVCGLHIENFFIFYIISLLHLDVFLLYILCILIY